MKKLLPLLTALALVGSIQAQTFMPQILMPSGEPDAFRLSLDGEWLFRYAEAGPAATDSLFFQPGFDDSSWDGIQVPGSWETQGFATPHYDLTLKDGTGLYRRRFSVPDAWQGKQVFLAFDGVCYGFTLWIDGQEAGSFHSAYNRHIFDVSQLATPGSHLLAVRVDTHPMGWEFDVNDDWSLGGICRPVTLFALNPVHLYDLSVTTPLLADGGAEVLVSPVVTTGPADSSRKATGRRSKGKKAAEETLTIKACLYDAEGNLCATAAENCTAESAGNPAKTAPGLRLEVPAAKCRLWTAETPYLYRLETSLLRGEELCDRHSCRVGIREVSIQGNVLYLNGKTIKLRGTTHHDLSPLTGRWVTRENQLRDLQLLKRGNMNYVRTSHYPPTEDLIDLCDSLGIYVMCEVPFGKGDEHLRDTAYLPLLKDRARHTVARDKNHPSVIIWSVGNENPYTQLEKETGLYVASLDGTRPYLFPERGSTFRGFDARGRLPLASMYAPHYPTVDRVEDYGERFDKPIVFTEYAHALGTDFGQMQEIWDIILRHKGLAGGSVWELFDQGLLRQSTTAVCPDSITDFVWTDSLTFYDTQADYGTDGILYADRTPQTDYWQVRKVYSPVRLEGQASLQAHGLAVCSLKVVNHFDFTDLAEVQARWELLCGPDVVARGELPLKAAPHDTMQTMVPVQLPEPLANLYAADEAAAKGCRPALYFRFAFTDREGYCFYEKSVEAAPARLDFAAATGKSPVGERTEKQSAAARQQSSRKQASPQLNAAEIERLASLLEVHTGRKSSMSERATVANNPTRRHVGEHKRLALVSLKWVEKSRQRMVARCEFAPVGASGEVLAYEIYHNDTLASPRAAGQITFEACPGQAVRITYRLEGTGDWHLSEAGLSLKLPKAYENLHWVGQGPYSALPSRNALSEFGLWAINRNDLYYPGNRQGVEAALFSNNEGEGVLMWADSAFNLALEIHPDCLLTGHNCFLAMPYNKNVHPRNLRLIGEVPLEGSFMLKTCRLADPSGKGSDSVANELRPVFGDVESPLKPFAPFYHSYDR